MHYSYRGKNGQKHYAINTNFKPYFYVPSNTETGIKTIFGGNVKKVFVEHPGLVPNERAKYDWTAEADIPFHLRFTIDYFDEIEKQKIRVCFLDIETAKDKNGNYSAPMQAQNPITCIGVYDSFWQKHVTFLWHPTIVTPTQNKSNSHSFYLFKSEAQMATRFLEFLQETDPDIITGWNLNKFDAPYLINRLNNLAQRNELLNGAEALSPLSEVQNDRGYWKVRGRTMLDLMVYYRNYVPGEKESWRLDFVAMDEKLGIRKLPIKDAHDLWVADYKALIDYNKRDVEIMVKLDAELGIIDYWDEIRRMCKCTFDDVLTKTRLIDYYTLNFLKGKNLVLPTNTPNKKKTSSLKGGAVLEPSFGLHRGVAQADLKSLYPSLIINFNLSPDSIDKDGQIKIANIASFKENPKGIFPQMLQQMYDKRIGWQQEMLSTSDKQKYRELKAKQEALKIIMNSFYGVLANEGYRFFKQEIAASITYLGRKTVTHCKTQFEKQGLEVIGSDTDSGFFKNPKEEMNLEQAQRFVETVNKTFAEFAKHYGAKENTSLKIELKEIYETIFFTKKDSGQAAKKRYAAKRKWNLKDGYKTDYIFIGFDTVRSDSSREARSIQKEILKMVLDGCNSYDVYNVYKQRVNKILSGQIKAERLGIPKAIRKHLYRTDDSGYKGNVFHAAASRTANKLHNAKIVQGDKVKVVYIKGKQGIETIAFKNDELYDGYEIDYGKMVEKTVLPKVRRIFESMQWDLNALGGQKKIFRWVK